MRERAITQAREPEAVEEGTMMEGVFLALYRGFGEAVARGEDPDPEEWIMEGAEAAGVDPGELARYILTEAEEDPAVEALEPDLDRAGAIVVPVHYREERDG